MRASRSRTWCGCEECRAATPPAVMPGLEPASRRASRTSCGVDLDARRSPAGRLVARRPLDPRFRGDDSEDESTRSGEHGHENRRRGGDRHGGRIGAGAGRRRKRSPPRARGSTVLDLQRVRRGGGRAGDRRHRRRRRRGGRGLRRVRRSRKRKPRTARRASSSIAPESASPSASSGATARIRSAISRQVIRVNLVGTFNMIRLVAASLIKARAARGRRAGRHRLDRLGRRLRGPDRPGRLFRLEGRRRRDDPADRARSRAASASASIRSRRASS